MTKAITVLGLMFGDEGKGSIVDAIVRREGAGLVVRFNGGCQAAHHVVTAAGEEHCFAQFGSGTLAGVRTLLTGMVVDPFALEREATALQMHAIVNPLAKLTIDASCLVTTPLHAALNKARELHREARHGSCGRGVGEAVDFARQNPLIALRVGDLSSEGVTYRKLRSFVDITRDEWTELGAHECLTMPRSVLATGFEPSAKMAAELLSYAYLLFARKFTDCIIRNPAVFLDQALSDAPVVFEGAHGVLLDEWNGFHPHTTWATTTDARVAELLDVVKFGGETRTVGVLRAYVTRHGHGPLPTEGLVPVDVSDDHNKPGVWQGPLRTGAFDVPLARYAIEANGGVDTLALTHLDKVKSEWAMAVDYLAAPPLLPASTKDDARLAWQEAVGKKLATAIPKVNFYETRDTFVTAVEQLLGVPVGIESYGPTAEDKTFRPAYTGEKVVPA